MPLQPLHCESVVLGIIGVMPVSDQRSPHCASFPPVVWLRKNTRRLSICVSIVVTHQSSSDRGSRVFDRACILLSAVSKAEVGYHVLESPQSTSIAVVLCKTQSHSRARPLLNCTILTTESKFVVISGQAAQYQDRSRVRANECELSPRQRKSIKIRVHCHSEHKSTGRSKDLDSSRPRQGELRRHVVARSRCGEGRHGGWEKIWRGSFV